MAHRSKERSAPLYFDDVLYLLAPATGLVGSGDGLVDYSLKLAAAGEAASLALFQVQKTQTDSTAAYTAKEGVTYGAEVLLKHLYSGLYLSMDPLAASKVQLLPGSEKARVRVLPVSAGKESIGSLVYSSAPLVLLFQYRQTHLGLCVGAGQSLDLSPDPDSWQFQLAYEPAVYPQVTPFSFVHLQHTGFPSFLSLAAQDLTGLPEHHAISTYWQLEPCDKPGHYRLLNLFTQTYLTSQQNSTISIVTAGSEAKELAYHTSCLLVSLDTVLGVSQDKVTNTTTERLLKAADSVSLLRYQFAGDRSYFQVLPVDLDTGNRLNRLCRIAAKMRNTENWDRLEEVCRLGLAWVQGNMHDIGAFIGDSGLLGAVIDAYVRIVGVRIRRNEGNMLKSLILPACQVLISAITQENSSNSPLLLYLPYVFWLRQQLEAYNPDPQLNFDVVCRILLDKNVKIAHYPRPQTSLDPCLDPSSSLHWVQQLSPLTAFNVSYQALVLRLLNHMIYSEGRYARDQAAAIEAQTSSGKLPRLATIGGEVCVLVEADSLEDFKRLNPKLQGTASHFEAGRVQLPFLELAGKEEVYWRYFTMCVQLNGLLQPASSGPMLISLADSQKHVNIRLLRTCLHVLSIVLFPRWRRVPLYEALARSGLNSTPLGHLADIRALLIAHLGSEEIAEAVEVEHTNSLLYLDEVVKCATLLLRNFVLDSEFIRVVMRLLADLIAGFGVQTTLESSTAWVSREVKECLRVGLTSKRRLALQRLLSSTVSLLHTLIQACELHLIWTALDLRTHQASHRFLPDLIIAQSFVLSLSPANPAVPEANTPLLPKTPLSAAGPSLIPLLQRLVFTQAALLGPAKAKILQICDQLSSLTESLSKALNCIFRANDRELQSLMDFISTKAQSIDQELELGQAPAYDTAGRYLEAVTDLLVDSSIRRVVQRVIRLLGINKRVAEISLRASHYPSLEQETITYLSALYYRKASKAGKTALKDLSSVHLTPICDLLFTRKEVRQAGNEDRERLADWALAQTNLRAYYLLKNLVLCDFNRLENALLVSNRMIKRLKLAQSHPNSVKSQVEVAISLHILTLCSHSELVQGQIMHLLSPSILENAFKHPLALASAFELLLYLAKETDNRGVKDYLSIVVAEVAANMESLVRNKAISLLDLDSAYDYIAIKQEPAVRRKRKNELSLLENESMALAQWKMLLTSDKLVSKGVIAVLIKAFAGNVEHKGLWKVTDRLQEPLRRLIYCVIEVQKKDLEGSYERLVRKLRVCLELMEQKKGTAGPNYGFKFVSALSYKRNLRKLPLFPLEIPESGLNFSSAESYLQSLYVVLHGSGYSHLYMDALLSIVSTVQAKEAADPLCSLVMSSGLLWDVCEAVSSADLSLCQVGLKVLIGLLRPASVQQRNSFKDFLEGRKLHGGLVGKYSELLSSLCSQVGEYGVKCEAALGKGQDPTNLPVADSFYERLEIGLEFLRLVQLTCDLCNHPFQAFYSQWPYSGTESVVWTLAKGLSDLRQSVRLFLSLRGREAAQPGTFETETLHMTFALGEEVCRLVAGLLDGLQELATGPCAVNQSLLSRNSQLLLALNQLLQVTIEPDKVLYGKTVELLLALAEGDPEDAVIDRLVEILNLGLCLRQIEAAFRAEKEGKSSDQSESFTKLFIFLLTLRQRRPTSPVLAQLPASLCYAHYLSKVGYVEIAKAGLVKGLHFPIPPRVQHMTLRTRASVIWDIDRSTQMNQINEFMQRVKIWNYEMQHQANISKIRSFKLLTAQWQPAGWLGLGLIVALNVGLMVQVERPEQLIDGNLLPNRVIYTVFGVLQTVMGVIQYVCYYIEYYPNLLFEQEISKKEILKGLVLEQPLALQAEPSDPNLTPSTSLFSALFCRWDSLRFISYLLCSLLAFYFPFCYGLLLLDIIRKNSGIEVVLQSITINKGRLLLTFCLELLIVYIFSIFGFVFFKEELDGVNGIVCTDLLHCFTSLFGVGMKSQGEMLALANPSDPMFWWRVLFDFSFFILVIVILLNITFGIILNSFSQLRDEKQEKLKDIYSRCYICGHHRSEINLRGGGWRWHLVGEHSPFAYIAFLIYVMDKPEDLCSGLEQYVKVQYLAGNYSFMPTTSKQLQEAR